MGSGQAAGKEDLNSRSWGLPPALQATCFLNSILPKGLVVLHLSESLSPAGCLPEAFSLQPPGDEELGLGQKASEHTACEHLCDSKLARALEGLKQGDGLKFQANLGLHMRPCLKNKQTRPKRLLVSALNMWTGMSEILF